jgi:hypothetical protein
MERMKALNIEITPRIENTWIKPMYSDRKPTMNGEVEAIPLRKVYANPRVSSRRWEGINSIMKVSASPEWPETKTPINIKIRYTTQGVFKEVNPKMARPAMMNPPMITGFLLPIQSIKAPRKGRQIAPDRDIRP